ncbi:MAG: clostripain-related cysteine peptidase [Thermoplasmatota archaeon]
MKRYALEGPNIRDGPPISSSVRHISPGSRLSLIAVVLMSVLLLISLSIFLIFYEGPQHSDTKPGNGDQYGDLVLSVDQLPEELRSGMQEEISGYVKDDMGRGMDGVSLSLNFSGGFDQVYKTNTDPNGRFNMIFWTPEIETERDLSFRISTGKDGYSGSSNDYRRTVTVPESWTFMIYMSDCDLESWAIKDLNELEKIGESKYLDIVVQLDRWESRSPTDDRSNGNWTTAKRFLIEPDMDDSQIGSEELLDLGEIDSSDPGSLVDFASWTMDNYESDNYALILWNHGSGVEGICWEQSNDEDEMMSIRELGEALGAITVNGAEPLDIIGFDACLMSAIEVAYEIHPYGRLMVGSEITEPNFGWDYSTLDELVSDPFMEGGDIAAALVDSYVRQIDTVSSVRSVSLGVYELAKIPAVVSNIDTLSNTINSAGPAEVYNMRLARKYAQPISDGYSSDAVDLADYVENILDLSGNSKVQEDSENLLLSIHDSVVKFEKRQGFGDLETDGLNGLSIFSPDLRDVFQSNEDYGDLKFSSDTSWTETLMSFYDSMDADMKDRVLSFDVDCSSCRVMDQDGDLLPDTIDYEFKVISQLEETSEAFLAINVYNLRGMYIDSTWLTINVSMDDPVTVSILFWPDEGDDPGMYRISAYLCIGGSFDPLGLQDYTRTRYRWLEPRE